MIVNTDGLTVKQLKEFIATLPDTDSAGNDTEVWVETTPGYSSVATAACRLNEGDLLLALGDD